MVKDGDDARAVTPVIGNILLVAVVVVLAVALVLLSLTFLEETGTPTAEASFDYEQTPAGLRMTPEALGTDVAVKLNGKQVTTFSADSAGESVLLPTAPGDSITVVSQDGDRSVLVNKQVEDRSEVGNFIAYYTFDSDSGDTLKDRSGNGNDGDIQGNPVWRGSSLDFDGDDDYVTVDSLDAETSVSEFTVAVAYRPDSADHQELIEHIDTEDGTNLVLELKGGSDDTYDIAYTVDDNGGQQNGEIFAKGYDRGERHVVVGTYDSDSYELYVDGDEAANASNPPREISLGDLTVASDAETSLDQHFDGDIYEIRLYYEAFDQQEVEVVTNAMS
ncbi:MAG: LamG-like jellyroll fold domain-containing protein [Haloarculaceae archaeon]